jgi:hypothetical protein
VVWRHRRVRPLSQDGGKSLVVLLGGIDQYRNDHGTHGAAMLLRHVSRCQKRRASDAGGEFLQELQSLGAKFGAGGYGHSGQIAARPSQARDEASSDGVVLKVGNDRNGPGRLLRSFMVTPLRPTLLLWSRPLFAD